MITRNHVWSLKVLNLWGDWLIPETLGVLVCSLSNESAFQGLKIRICCGKQQVRDWERVITSASELYIVRYDACGCLLEKWHLTKTNISNVFVEETSGLFGDFLHFDVRAVFHKVS